ncbi:MAG: acetate--CoA ligase family protein [Thermodesulfobacteriota bacterium]
MEDLITRALAQGQKALSEYESKKVLAGYGLPVAREVLAGGEDEAAGAAEGLGWPVVLKACGPELMHKSEGGLIVLGLEDRDAVRAAYRRLRDQAGAGAEGVLVQETVPGPRELLLGLHRDPQFGPVVVAGLGGVLTEILNDAAFRLAPLDEAEARDMLEELRGRKIFKAFRGQAPADLGAVCRSLVGLGRLGLERPEVAEVDVNPLIIRPDGRVTAVDALVVLKGAAKDA